MTSNNELKLGVQAENHTYARLSGGFVLLDNDIVDRVPDGSRVAGTVLLSSVDDDFRDEIRDEIEPVDAQSIVRELSTGTFYTERHAEYWVLKNLFSMDRPDIAEEMEVSKSRVDDIRIQVEETEAEIITTLRKTSKLEREGPASFSD